MKLIDGYLNIIQTEFGGYANPIQTRPLPKSGITKEKPDKELPPGVRGPSGSKVDLDRDKLQGYNFKNFSHTIYSNDEKENMKKRGRKSK